jgi:bacillithiol system protein YtxJ
MITWKELVDTQTVDEIVGLSSQTPYLIFKHSTRCSISAMAKMRLEHSWDFGADEIQPYYLDLIAFRQVSNYIAEKFSVYHESPQALLIWQGECIYDASHLDISVPELKEALAALHS